jgi:hypothetical protein
MRRSVQSYVEFGLFPLDETLLSSAANNTFRNYRERDSLQNEVRNAEACSVESTCHGWSAMSSLKSLLEIDIPLPFQGFRFGPSS